MSSPVEEAASELSITDRIFPIRTIRTPRIAHTPFTDNASAFGPQVRHPLEVNPFEQTLNRFHSPPAFASGNAQASATFDPCNGQLGPHQVEGTSEDSNTQPESTVRSSSALQRHGLVLVLEVADASRVLPVQAVSNNSEDIISKSPQELFALCSFTDIFSLDQADVLREHIHLIRSNSGRPAGSASDVFTLRLEDGRGHTLQLLCALHQGDTSRLIFCDLEVKQEQAIPDILSSSRTAPRSDRRAVNQSGNPRSALLEDDQPNVTTPIPKRLRRKLDSLSILRVMSQIQDRLAVCTDLVQLVDTIADITKEVTACDRTIVCQYDSRGFGRVIAEAAAMTVPSPLYHGLRFRLPELPAQQKETDNVSVLYDRDATSCTLVHRPEKTLQIPLNVTHSFMRKASAIRPLHISDMDVRSAVSIHIKESSRLWGIIEGYSTEPCGKRISFLIRRLCGVISDAASSNIQRLSSESRMSAWKTVQRMHLADDPVSSKLTSTTELLRSFRADSGFILAGDQVETLGRLQHPQEAMAILKHLAERDIVFIIASTDIRADLPDLEYPLGFIGISGLLVVPLCLGGNEFMVFFRNAKLRQVTWAGNPYNLVASFGAKGSKRSFEPWTELTTEIGEEWSEQEIETATVLCLLSERARKVFRLEQSQLRGDAIAQLLLKNSAHELRTPLNAIVNYLEIARNGDLGAEIREYLDRSHTASQSLICAIDDMLTFDDKSLEKA